MVLPLGFGTTENNTSLSQFLSRITKTFLLDLEHGTSKYDNLLYQIFFSKCVCACMHMQVCACSAHESCWGQKGYQIPCTQNPRHLWTIRNGCWEWNPDSLEERWVLNYHLFFPCIDYFKRKAVWEMYHVRRTSSALGIGWKTLVWPRWEGPSLFSERRGIYFLGDT